MPKESYSRLENDCIAIICWCYKNRDKKQSFRILEEELGIPSSTSQNIIKGWRYYGENHWALASYAEKYGYSVTYVGKPGCLIWVDKKGGEYYE